jgi:hypothetical protein
VLVDVCKVRGRAGAIFSTVTLFQALHGETGILRATPTIRPPVELHSLTILDRAGDAAVTLIAVTAQAAGAGFTFPLVEEA